MRDIDDDFTVSIDAANPMNRVNAWDEKRWDRQIMARHMIENRHSKLALIDLTHWLLTRAERSELALKLLDQMLEGVLEGDKPNSIQLESGQVIEGPVADEIIDFMEGIAAIVHSALGKRAPSKAKAA